MITTLVKFTTILESTTHSDSGRVLIAKRNIQPRRKSWFNPNVDGGNPTHSVVGLKRLHIFGGITRLSLDTSEIKTFHHATSPGAGLVKASA